jgi:hypothetical protein
VSQATGLLRQPAYLGGLALGRGWTASLVLNTGVDLGLSALQGLQETGNQGEDIHAKGQSLGRPRQPPYLLLILLSYGRPGEVGAHCHAMHGRPATSFTCQSLSESPFPLPCLYRLT